MIAIIFVKEEFLFGRTKIWFSPFDCDGTDLATEFAVASCNLRVRALRVCGARLAVQGIHN